MLSAFLRCPLRLFSFSLFRASWCSLYSFAGLLVPWRSRYLFFLLFLFSSLLFFSFSFSFSSLIHLTFPASLLFSLLLFLIHLFLLFSCSLFFLSHLTFPAYLSLSSHYTLMDSVQCDKPLFLISVVPAVQIVRGNPPFSGQVIDFELLVRETLPSAGQISVGAPAHLRRLPTAGNSVKLIDRVNGSATRLPWQCDSSVETRLFPDKLLILNHLSVKPCLFPDKLLILCQPISVISRLSVKPHLLPDKLFWQRL